MMVAFGNTEAQVAQIIGISEPTLRLHYEAELRNGFLKANNAVASNLFRQATKDDPRAFAAIKFWLNCRAGWSEYAPPPKAPDANKPEKLGKKEQAVRDAETAEKDTGWERLVH